MSRWEPLLTVQELDTHLDQLAHRLQNLAVRGALAELDSEGARLDGLLAVVDERRSLLLREQTRLDDEVASLRTRAAQADKQLYSGTTNNPRELQALQDDIESIKRRISKVEDDELDVMEAMEPVDAERGGLLAQRGANDEKAQVLRAALAEAESEIETERASIQQQRDAAAVDIDPELWAEYNSLRKRLGGIAIARLVGSTCQGCHLGLSAVEVDRIRHLGVDETVHCEECGRLLVRS